MMRLVKVAVNGVMVVNMVLVGVGVGAHHGNHGGDGGDGGGHGDDGGDTNSKQDSTGSNHSLGCCHHWLWRQGQATGSIF